jgi:hypothetical protein
VRLDRHAGAHVVAAASAATATSAAAATATSATAADSAVSGQAFSDARTTTAEHRQQHHQRDSHAAHLSIPRAVRSPASRAGAVVSSGEQVLGSRDARLYRRRDSWSIPAIQRDPTGQKITAIELASMTPGGPVVQLFRVGL